MWSMFRGPLTGVTIGSSPMPRPLVAVQLDVRGAADLGDVHRRHDVDLEYLMQQRQFS